MSDRRLGWVLQRVCRLFRAPDADCLSDGQLLTRYRLHQDQGAFEALVQRYGPMVLGVCRRHVKNADDADDAFQATFLVLVQRAHAVAKEESVGSWLYGVACRTARRARHLANRRQAREQEGGALAHEPSRGEATWDDLRLVIDEEVNRLPEKYRGPVVLCYLEGKTNEEAATQLQCPAGTIKWRLAQAREVLRGRLARRGLAMAAPALAVALTENTAAAVSAALLHATLQTTAPAAAVIPARVATLTEGVLHEMFLTKLKTVAVLLTALFLTGFGVGWGAYHLGAAQAPAQLPPAAAQKKPATVKHPAEPADAADAPVPATVLARLGSERLRHAGDVTTLVFGASPANRWLLSSGRDGTIRLWDVNTGKELRRLDGHQPGEIIAATLSADGTRVVSAGTGDRLIRLWDTATGKLLGTLENGGQQVAAQPWSFPAPAFAPDGQKLACVRMDQEAIKDQGFQRFRSLTSVVLWDVAARKEVRKLELGELGGDIRGVAFAPDGKLLVAAVNSFDGTFPGFPAPPPNGGGGVVGNNGGAVGLPGGGPAAALGGGGFLGGGKGMAGPGGPGGPPNLSQNYSLLVWDAATGKLLRRLKGHPGRAEALVYHPNGNLVATASDESPLGVGIYDGPGMVRLWNPATGKEVRSWRASRSGALGLAFSPDGKHLAAGSWEGFSLWRTDPPALHKRVNAPVPATDRLSCLAFSPDGKTLATGNHHAIRLWDVARGKETSAAGHTKAISHLDFSADGRSLLTTTGEGFVSLWEPATGRLRQRFPATNHWPTSAALAPDGKVVATAPHVGPVQLWDAASAKKLRSLGGNEIEHVYCCAFAPDGARLAVVYLKAAKGNASPTAQLALWETATGRKVRQVSFLKSAYGIGAVVFSPDGQKVAVADPLTQGIVLWDVATGKEVGRTGGQGPGGAAFGLNAVTSHFTFFGDGKTLILGTAPQQAFGGFGFGLGNGLPFPGAGGPGGPPAADDKAPRLSLWDTTTGSERGSFGPTDGVRALAVSPDGRMVATANGRDAVVRLWELATRKERGRLRVAQGAVTALRFTPDGKALAAGGTDTTVLLLDILAPAPGGPAVADWNDRRAADQLWNDLRGDDAARAYRALCLLTRTPAESVTFLKEQLGQMTPLDPKRVEKLIANLDSPQFETRNMAHQELRNLGSAAEPFLRQALANQPPLEARRRMEKLLEDLPLSAGTRVVLRSVELLERLGTAEARQLLETVAGGLPQGQATHEARAALYRLRKAAP
jgi:RNA polymerase sigma factor (sigma-70 family)